MGNLWPEKKVCNDSFSLHWTIAAGFLEAQKVHTRKGVHFLLFFAGGGPPGGNPLVPRVCGCEETLCSWRCVGMIAVTHVLVNDPTRGYGIFIRTMLDAAA